ncbi:ribokinase [Rhodococcus rhodnii]|uniref:Ribokinase n=2 Tax=Rhodococcus rhodnii TaxID=38312 RepID=R7WR29_9NOCA|nr:ribokinase [Rhodococcus rhodnii]EOM76429.1 ribokinase [Rhodococcus rhodnii LMG 5362]TXG91544.1 ribokinase [Rhodococcus rhodnii]
MAPSRIVVVGSVNADLSARVDALPRPGATVLARSFDVGQGGKGANQAIAAARAGGTVAFVGAVGSDAFAPMLRDALAGAGVDTRELRTERGPSGVAIVTVDSAGENSIVVAAGANSTVTTLTDSDLDLIAAADVLVCQFEIPLPAVTAAARHAARHGTEVIVNPSPVQRLPDDLAAVVDVLVVNEGEERTLREDLGAVPHVVTTLGRSGARARSADGTETRVPAPEVTAVDTTGAGDAFTGAFGVRWAELAGDRDRMQGALEFGCAAGALATTRRGADSAPTRAEIEAM